ncbi:MAG: tRNA 4-thiouridine(8) synthase ThiI [Tissierellia bacterium]|nr:tRNA 4-thiouridine(8) synthase ThiI [Tissierellia bacterium]
MKLLLLKYGEIALKGKNRRFFENQLITNIKERLLGYDYKLENIKGRIYVHYEDPQVPLILKDTFGLVEVCLCERVELNLKSLEEMIFTMLSTYELSGKSFKIESRRSNKGYFMTSPELSKHLGGFVLNSFPQLRVDVHNPDILVEVEVRELFYVYIERHRALGGMPLGTAGKAVQLMSGGIDSPVAAYQMARRGVNILPLHFQAQPFTSEESLEKVRTLVRKLSYYMGDMSFYHINLLESQQLIRENCDEKYFTILQRRLMTKLAVGLAKKEKALALVTGENLAQVASQTMEGINCTNDASDRPIFRPLISFDKEDIVKIAKKIDTYETSILPFADACTVFLPSRVETRPKLKDVLAEEAKVDQEELYQLAWQTLVKEKL